MTRPPDDRRGPRAPYAGLVTSVLLVGLLATGCGDTHGLGAASKDAGFTQCSRSADHPSGKPATWSESEVTAYVTQPWVLRCALDLPEKTRSDLLDRTLGSRSPDAGMKVLSAFVTSSKGPAAAIAEDLGILARHVAIPSSNADSDRVRRYAEGHARDDQDRLLAFWAYQQGHGAMPGFAAWRARHRDATGVGLLGYVDQVLRSGHAGSAKARAWTAIDTLATRIGEARAH